MYDAKLKYYELIYDPKFMTDLKNTNCGRLDNPSTIFNSIFRYLLNNCNGNYLCFYHHDGHRSQFLLSWSYINACPCMGSSVRLWFVYQLCCVIAFNYSHIAVSETQYDWRKIEQVTRKANFIHFWWKLWYPQFFPKNRTKLTILSKEDAQNNEFCSFFGRIHETITCFRDLLTFSWRH